VYACTGDPLPSDIEAITTALLNSSFSETYCMLRTMTSEKGYALTDILTSIADQIMKMQLPPASYMKILKELSNVE
jgi:replication factor C subunit 3/5